MKSENKNKTAACSDRRERIGEFWRWFASVQDKLAALLEKGVTEEIARMVAAKMNELTNEVGWEVGPGAERPYSFSIALNGSLENLAVAEEIVKEAPVLPNWEIYAGRPPKNWDGRIRLRNKQGQVVTLDSSGWRYILAGYDGNSFFDIAIIADWPIMDLAAKKQAASLAIQAVLGEVTMLKRFDRVKVVVSPSPDQLARSSSISDLKNHLDHLDATLTR